MDILTDLPQPAASGAPKQLAAVAWLRAQIQSLRGESPWEFVVLVVMTGFLLFYGLIPVFGGDQVGLVGADEPRYAQIAREMLNAHSEVCHAYKASIFPSSPTPKAIENSLRCLDGGTVTPILYGQPWLEKPALY